MGDAQGRHPRSAWAAGAHPGQHGCVLPHVPSKAKSDGPYESHCTLISGNHASATRVLIPRILNSLYPCFPVLCILTSPFPSLFGTSQSPPGVGDWLIDVSKWQTLPAGHGKRTLIARRKVASISGTGCTDNIEVTRSMAWTSRSSSKHTDTAGGSTHAPCTAISRDNGQRCCTSRTYSDGLSAPAHALSDWHVCRAEAVVATDGSDGDVVQRLQEITGAPSSLTCDIAPWPRHAFHAN